MSFEHFALENACQPCPPCRFCPSIGQNYASKNDRLQGRYWYYEDEDFVIDVHDFFYQEDTFHDRFEHLDPNFSFSAIYFFAANGEFFAPYQAIAPNSLLIIDTQREDLSYIIHGQSSLKAVGVHFKESMLVDNEHNFEQIFLETKADIVSPLGKLAEQIMNQPATLEKGEQYMKDVAKEWLRLTIEACQNHPQSRGLSPADEATIQVVAKYIDDHLALDIPQATLEKISHMSGTKLKNTFKKKYHMSITEYTQRARMNLAETLILNTKLDMEHIAQAIGYQSQGRFSTLFKRYKGVSPSSLRNHTHIIRCPRKALGFSDEYNDLLL